MARVGTKYHKWLGMGSSTLIACFVWSLRLVRKRVTIQDLSTSNAVSGAWQNSSSYYSARSPPACLELPLMHMRPGDRETPRWASYTFHSINANKLELNDSLRVAITIFTPSNVLNESASTAPVACLLPYKQVIKESLPQPCVPAVVSLPIYLSGTGIGQLGGTGTGNWRNWGPACMWLGSTIRAMSSLVLCSLVSSSHRLPPPISCLLRHKSTWVGV